MAIKRRSIVHIDKDDFKFCQKLIKNNGYFKNNIHLFTLATLVGKYVVNESKKIPKGKSKDFFRVQDNINDDNMIVLKCFAISSSKDVSILNNEDDLFSYCEKYANSGIKEIKNWEKLDFNTELSEVLMKFWNEIDFDLLETL